MNLNWTEYKLFPDPRKQEYLFAPFGAGVYELHNCSTDELVLVGRGNNVASRMSSLLPKPHGCGTRKNKKKREYVLQNLHDVEYRTLTCIDKSESKSIEKYLRKLNRKKYLFKT